jgi:hypothetical protein
VDGWWGVAVVGLVLFGWTFYLDDRHHFEKRLATWWLARARRNVGRAGVDAFLVSAGLLLCFSVLAWAAHRMATGLDTPLLSLAVTGPAMLAYAPFVLATMPTQAGAYWAWRQELAMVGAEPTEQRAIAWWAGPPSLAGLMAILLALVSAFVL